MRLRHKLFWIGLLSATAAPGFAAQDAPTESLTASNVTASYGRIRPFYGRIRPFEISTFWAGTNAFSTTDAGLMEFWGRIRPFWGRIRGFWEGAEGAVGLTSRWGRIRGFWGEGEYASLYAGLDDPAKFDLLRSNLDTFLLDARNFWDPMIREQTAGASSFDGFLADFAVKVSQRHQLDIMTNGAIDAAKVASWDEEQRAKFIVEWYDGLMSYSGSDHVDHWMKTAKWTPAITEQQGKGADAVIGLLDSVITGDPDLVKKIAYQAGNGSFSDGHGAAVLSLLVASHDGRGVMGIAPNAKVAAYNPFDSTGTASWDEVANGVKALGRAGAHVINLSLGVPGFTLHPEWNKVLSTSDAVKAISGNNVALVFAAGNEGVTQTANIEWASKLNPSFIVVGSADPNGNLSTFSNRPGNVCLMEKGNCVELLSHRFIIAPGELLLVSDDKGGVIRHSGTSFAAPLVAGTIALLHDRWPWLKRFPKEATDIVLQSATPIAGSTPGETGRGLLNIEASQSPLNFDRLAYYEHVDGTTSSKKSAGQILKSGLHEATWEAKGVYFTAFETIGATQRDFAIPLSNKLVDQTLVVNGSQEKFQHYIRSRFVDWMKKATGQTGFTAPVSNSFGWNVSMKLVPGADYGAGGATPGMALRFATASEAMAISVGHGGGAFALTARPGLAGEDFDVRHGGVEPILGYASGDAYASVELAISRDVSVAAGVTRKEARRSLHGEATAGDNLQLSSLDAYRAGAAHVTVKYRPVEALALSAAYTDLDEESGLLGVQSIDRSDLAGGTRSRSGSLAADLALGSGFNLSASASLSRTESGARQNLRIAKGGLKGSAFHLALSKEGLFSSADRARLLVSQPLFVEQGQLEYTQIKVVDRETGEIGPVTERFSISGSKRPFVAEALYGALLLNGRTEFSAFTRAEQQSDSRGGDREYIAGARIGFTF